MDLNLRSQIYINKIFLIGVFTLLSKNLFSQIPRLGTAWNASIILERMGPWWNAGSNFTYEPLKYHVLPKTITKVSNVYGKAYFLDILDSTGKVVEMKMLSLEIYSGSTYNLIDLVQFVFNGESSEKRTMGITADSLDKVQLRPETMAIAKWFFIQEKKRVFKRLPPIKPNSSRVQPKIAALNEFFHIANFNLDKSPSNGN